MKKLKIFLASVLCLTFCFFGFGCSNNNNQTTNNNNNNNPQNPPTIESPSGDNNTDTKPSKPATSNTELVAFVVLMDIGNFQEGFVTSDYISENVTYSDGNLSSTIPFINIISSSSNYQNEEDLTTSRMQAIQNNTSLEDSKFNTSILSEVLLETRTIYVFVATKTDGNISFSQIGRTDFDAFSFDDPDANKISASLNNLYKDININEIEFLFSVDLSSPDMY